MLKVFLTIIILFLSTNVSATIIQLKSGELVFGEVVDRTENSIKVDAGMDEVVIYSFDEIESIDGEEVVVAEEEKPEDNIPEEERATVAWEHYNAGLEQFKQGQYDEALENMTVAAKIQPDDGYLHYILGQVYFYKRMLKEATASYKKAIELKPELVEAYIALGQAIRNDSPDESIALFEKSIAINPKFVQGYLELAYTYSYSGEHEKAVKNFNQALLIEPNNIKILKTLGEAYAFAEEYEKAIPIYERVLNIKSEDVATVNILARCLVASQRFEEALVYLKKSIEINSNDGDMYLVLGTTYYNLGDMSQAKIQYDQALKIYNEQHEAGKAQAAEMFLEKLQ